MGVIRSLGEKGIRPDAVIVSRDGKSFVGKSKYIRKLHIVCQNSEVTPYLLSHLKQDGEKSVVICCHDGASSEIDLHLDELKEFFILPGAEKQGQITKLMSKQVMSDLAHVCGFSLPKTIYPQHLPLAADEVYLPCIVKPLVSKNGTKDDIRICENISEAAGMSLPYIWYLDCLGNDYSNEANKEIKSVYVMPDMAELKLLVTRQISLREYISDFKKTNRFMEYDKRDSKPFWKLVIFHICSRLGI